MATQALGGVQRLQAPVGCFSFGMAVLIFNLLDGLFTLTYLQLGVARELNPLMRLAYEGSPLLFMALKLFVVQAGVWLLFQHLERPAAWFALRAGAAVYAAIVAYHLGFLLRVWPA